MGALEYRDRIQGMAGQQPVQPTMVAKELSTNSMLASAMLSEMTEKGLLKVSYLKVGSSPLYYHPEHPEHLLNYMQYLNEKDRKTVTLLQKECVLQDKSQDPLTRVSLRNTKDFAKPLDVTVDGAKELFWKFYLLTDEGATERIRQILQPPVAAPAAQVEPQSKPRKPRVKKPKAVVAEPQQTLAHPTEAQAPLPPPQEQVIADDPFLQQLTSFFTANNITILEQVVLKRKNEYDFVLKIGSPVGELHYYCKAKNKMKIGEADLSHAFVQGQLKKLPVLFLAPGSLTKPAQDLLKELKGLTVKQV